MATISASIPLAANMKILVNALSQAEIDDALAAKYASVIGNITVHAAQGKSSTTFLYLTYSQFSDGTLADGVVTNESEFTGLMTRYGYTVTKSDTNNDSYTTVTVSWA
jgi:hypothetical protein